MPRSGDEFVWIEKIVWRRGRALPSDAKSPASRAFKAVRTHARADSSLSAGCKFPDGAILASMFHGAEHSQAKHDGKEKFRETAV